MVLRFFVRSCLEYTVFYRWLTLRNKLDEYFFKLNKGKKTKKDEDELNRVIQICLIDTNSVRTFPKMVFDNLRMAFLWPLLILFGLTFVGFQSQPLTLSIKIVLIPVTAMIIYEIYSFISYLSFQIYKGIGLHKNRQTKSTVLNDCLSTRISGFEFLAESTPMPSPNKR